MKNIAVTKHARERWDERFPGRDLDSELNASLPFGAQKGDSTVLLNGDAAFVVAKGALVTCLTKDMAIANMQTAGVVFRAIAEFERKVLPKISRKTTEQETASGMVRKIAACDKRTVSIVSQTLCDASEDDLNHLAKSTALSLVCQMIVSLRRKAQKAQNHARLTESRLSAFRKAIIKAVDFKAFKEITAEANRIADAKKEGKCD
jgi:hypothetical protein